MARLDDYYELSNTPYYACAFFTKCDRMVQLGISPVLDGLLIWDGCS